MPVEREGDELMKTNSMISRSGGDRMFAIKSSRRLAAGLMLLLPLGLASCDALDSLISVEAPSQVAAQDLDNPANADLMVNSAVNDFRCALVHFIAAGAYVGNEWGGRRGHRRRIVRLVRREGILAHGLDLHVCHRRLLANSP
jgi:hypothetical protein